ncbi:MAG: hypothetical protein WAU48_01350 [Gammaproteobacteria bacterium]
MNKDLEKNLQDQLRASEDSLDAPTLARLHAARNRALDVAKGRAPQWAGSWLTATAAAGVAAIALFIAIKQQPDVGPHKVTELESTLLAAASGAGVSAPVSDEPVPGAEDTAETIDLLENLDFYEWLSQEPAEEQQS